jgi:hypothetical protein
MKIFRTINGVLAEPMVIPKGMKVAQVYGDEIAALCVEVPDEAQPGWVADADGRYSAPPRQAPSVPDVDAVYALIQLSRTKTKDGKSDLLTAARALVTDAGGELQVWFERAQRWMRADPHVAQIAKALNLSSDDVDALFIAASKIPLEKAAP